VAFQNNGFILDTAGTWLDQALQSLARRGAACLFIEGATTTKKHQLKKLGLPEHLHVTLGMFENWRRSRDLGVTCYPERLP